MNVIPAPGQGYAIAVGKYRDRPVIGWGDRYLWGIRNLFTRYPDDKVTVIFLGNREDNDPAMITENGYITSLCFNWTMPWSSSLKTSNCVGMLHALLLGAHMHGGIA